MSTATGASAARTVDNTHRVQLMQELHRRYSRGGTAMRRRFWVKKYAWAIAVGGAKVLKRGLDIVVSLAMIVLLAPLFAFVALAIKLTDRGPVLFWQARVGPVGAGVPIPQIPFDGDECGKAQGYAAGAESAWRRGRDLQDEERSAGHMDRPHHPQAQYRRTAAVVVCAAGRYVDCGSAPAGTARSGVVHPGGPAAAGRDSRA